MKAPPSSVASISPDGPLDAAFALSPPFTDGTWDEGSLRQGGQRGGANRDDVPAMTTGSATPGWEPGTREAAREHEHEKGRTTEDLVMRVVERRRSVARSASSPSPTAVSATSSSSSVTRINPLAKAGASAWTDGASPLCGTIRAIDFATDATLCDIPREVDLFGVSGDGGGAVEGGLSSSTSTLSPAKKELISRLVSRRNSEPGSSSASGTPAEEATRCRYSPRRSLSRKPATTPPSTPDDVTPMKLQTGVAEQSPPVVLSNGRGLNSSRRSNVNGGGGSWTPSLRSDAGDRDDQARDGAVDASATRVRVAAALGYGHRTAASAAEFERRCDERRAARTSDAAIASTTRAVEARIVGEQAKWNVDEAGSSRDQARAALLAFLEHKACLRRIRRLQRSAFSRWLLRTHRGCRNETVASTDIHAGLDLTRADNSTRDGGVEVATQLASRRWSKWMAAAALRCWRRATEVARVEAELYSYRCTAETLEAIRELNSRVDLTTVCETPRHDTPHTAHVNHHFQEQLSRHGRTTTSLPPCSNVDNGHRPEWGEMDSKPEKRISGTGDKAEVASEAGMRGDDLNFGHLHGALVDSITRTRPGPGDRVCQSTIMSDLSNALRAAEDRARALEVENRELEADLYAAAVLWEETEAENASLRAEAKRAVEAAAAAAVAPLMGPLRAEVEELEACAMAMRKKWPQALERAARRLSGPIDYDQLRREFGIPPLAR